jgi:hypothetical protein
MQVAVILQGCLRTHASCSPCRAAAYVVPTRCGELATPGDSGQAEPSAPPHRPHPEFPQQCRRIGVAAHAEILEGCQRGAHFGRWHRLIGLSEQPVERQPGLHGVIGDLGLGEREQYCFQLPAGRFAIPGKVNRRIAAVFAPVA